MSPFLISSKILRLLISSASEADEEGTSIPTNLGCVLGDQWSKTKASSISKLTSMESKTPNPNGAACGTEVTSNDLNSRDFIKRSFTCSGIVSCTSNRTNDAKRLVRTSSDIISNKSSASSSFLSTSAFLHTRNA